MNVIYIYYVMEYTTSVYLNQMSRFCFVIYSAGWQDPYMRVNFSPPSAVSGATINLDLHSSLFDIYWKFYNNR